MALEGEDAESQSQRLDILRALGLIAAPENRPLLWERRGHWQVGFRWAVTPAMLVAVYVCRRIGFEFAVVPVLAVAVGIAVYNAAFSWIFNRYEAQMRIDPGLDRKVTVLQAVCDYLAVFLLIYFTGGASSPLALFLIFHVVIVAMQFFHRIVYLFAAWAAGGMWLLLAAQTLGWLPGHAVVFRGEPLYAQRPVSVAIGLLVFTVTVFVTAAMVGQIMRLLRSRVGKLSETTGELALANQKLNGLYHIVRTVGTERHLQPILNTVTSELAAVLAVPAVALKLLSGDGKTLRYVAAFGLPDDIKKEVIQVDQSPINQRVLAGESQVQGRIGEPKGLQIQSELTAVGIQSAALAPLRVADKVIGTLGIYSDKPHRFEARDFEFLELAAELVAIAIENARDNEAIEALMSERTQFMLEVAHNLRSPLSASLEIVEVLRTGYLGAVNERQKEYLERIDHRLRGLHATIGGLLTIARTRDWSREIPDVVVDVNELARHARRAFEQRAAAKKLRFAVAAEPDLPAIDSGADLLEQIVENLVGNAVKYTPEGGAVDVRFSRHGAEELRLTVKDTGIGIPLDEQGKLFREFFRASNAKKYTSEGTGLGLALVKQSVERHKGRIELHSQEGRGTTVVVDLPVHRP
jgi:signal transduction histidine kinase